jgi:hypothetical protein
MPSPERYCRQRISLVVGEVAAYVMDRAGARTYFKSDPAADGQPTTRITSMTHEIFCRVCGYEPADPPWGQDGAIPSFELCPSCGVEWATRTLPRTASAGSEPTGLPRGQGDRPDSRN